MFAPSSAGLNTRSEIELRIDDIGDCKKLFSQQTATSLNLYRLGTTYSSTKYKLHSSTETELRRQFIHRKKQKYMIALHTFAK